MPNKLINTTIGKGKLSDKDHFICDVTYKINYYQEMIISQSFNNVEQLPGQFLIKGEIKVLGINAQILQILSSGQTFTLKIDKKLPNNQNELKVLLNPVPGNPLDGFYQISIAAQ